MTIPTRSSGPSGIEISALGLGSWSTWNRADIDTVVETVRLALDAGVNFFDLGIYGADLGTPDPDATEMRFAEALRRLGVRRDDWVFAAKGWLPDPHRPGIAPLAPQLDALLRRQGTDHADILVLGDLMEPREDYSDFLTQVAGILRAGKARAWAVNNWAAREVAAITDQARALGIQGPDYAQHKYGLVRRSVPEGPEYRDLHALTGVRIQASDTFEGGLLFGPRAGGTSRYVGGDIGGVQSRIDAARPAMLRVAESLGTTLAALAIAVPLLSDVTANVLVGTRTPAQLRENLGAFDLLERHSAADIRAAAEPFWFDREVVSSDSGWGTRPDDDPATYVVRER